MPALHHMDDMSTHHLPDFRYHPDPVATGNVGPSTTACRVCQQARGYVYLHDAIHEGRGDYSEQICPWCIADGRAASTLDVAFACSLDIDESVPKSALEELSLRTPGYVSFQGEKWLAHCNDACRFLGDATMEQVSQASAATIAAWCAVNDADETRWLELVSDYAPGGDIGFYTFECLHCGLIQFHVDAA